MSSEQRSNPTPEGLMPRAEILALLQAHWCGFGPKRFKDPESTRIDYYLGFWNDSVSKRDEFFDYVRTVAMFFTCTISEQEIERLYKTKAKVSDLIDILAEQAPRRELRPKMAFSKPCTPAAVFDELVRAASAIKGQTIEAAPSTPLMTVLSPPQLRMLVSMAGFHFPEVWDKWKQIERPWLGGFATVGYHVRNASVFVGLAALLVGLVCVWSRAADLGLWLLLLGTVCATIAHLTAAALSKRAKRLDETESPFVDRIKTFRDLVNYLLAEGGARYVDSTRW